jgi:hypothetical protein
LELKHHLLDEDIRGFAEDDEVIDMSKNPGAISSSPENARVSDGNGETDLDKECAEPIVPRERCLLEPVDCFVELKVDVGAGEVSSRRSQVNLFIQIAGQEGRFDVKLVN